MAMMLPPFPAGVGSGRPWNTQAEAPLCARSGAPCVPEQAAAPWAGPKALPSAGAGGITWRLEGCWPITAEHPSCRVQLAIQQVFPFAPSAPDVES